jgi:hypothetical protein
LLTMTQKLTNWKSYAKEHSIWKWLYWALGAYVFFNFFYAEAIGGKSSFHPGNAPSVATIRLFSGHLMFFYAAAVAMHYSICELGSEASTGP